VEQFDSYQKAAFVIAVIVYVLGGAIIAKYKVELGRNKMLADILLLFVLMAILIGGTILFKTF
jgi:uncharacterized membrane protein